MSDFEILEKDTKKENINWMWGGWEYTITKEDIEALLEGKKLYAIIGDEYAITIELGVKENE